MTQHYLSVEQILKIRSQTVPGFSVDFARAIESATVAAYAAQQAPIDMVLHCPKCGMQHIDVDNSEEVRIEAAERGFVHGSQDWEAFVEEKEWTNPPHRSHLCHACDHIWRPADVPTNGVQAVKTTGKADSPIATPYPDAVQAAPAIPEGETLADRLDWLADRQTPGSQTQSDLFAAATIWRKHLKPSLLTQAAPAARELLATPPTPAPAPAVAVAAALSPHERSPWTEHHVKTYPRKAAQIINAALGFTPPTPAPAPAGGSEAVIWQARIALKTGVREINNLGGARQAMPLHYAIKAIDEYIAATPSMPAPATGGKGDNHG